MAYRDLYALPAHSGSGTINSVKVYARIYGHLFSDLFYIRIKTHASTYEQSFNPNAVDTWETHFYTWTNNPNTNEPWTWDEIDALQAGVGIIPADFFYQAKCTQVYVEVDYTPVSFVPYPHFSGMDGGIGEAMTGGIAH